MHVIGVSACDLTPTDTIAEFLSLINDQIDERISEGIAFSIFHAFHCVDIYNYTYTSHSGFRLQALHVMICIPFKF